MKKIKKKTSLSKKIGITALILFVCLVSAIEIIQSDWAKGKAKGLLMNALEESGFQVKIDKMEGNLPQYIKIEGVSIQGKGMEISVRSIEARLSLIRLLKKEIAFTSLNAEGVKWKSTAIIGTANEEIPIVPKTTQLSGFPKLPFAIYVEQFHLKDVAIPGYFTGDFDGRFRLSKRKSSFNIKGKRTGFPDSSARIFAVIKEDGATQVRAYVKTPTLKVFSPTPSKEPMDASLSAELVAAGPFLSFWKAEPGLTPVRGRVSGSLTPRDLALPDPMKGWIEKNWSFNAGFNKQESLSFSKISAKTDLLSIKGKASFDPAFHFSEANFQLISEQIISTLPIPSSGRFLAQVKLQPENGSLKGTAAWKIPFLTAGGFKVDDIKGTSIGTWTAGALAGSTQISGIYLSDRWNGKTDFSWKPKESVFLKNIDVEAPFLKGKGNLEVRPDWLLVGTTEMTAENLQTLHIPDQNLYGSLKVKGEWKAVTEPGTSIQGLYLDAAISDFYYGSFYARKATLYSDLLDPFHTLNGNLDLAFEQAKWGHLIFSSATMVTSARGLLKESQPFQIFAEGKWKHPLEIRIDGSWIYENRTFVAAIQNWKGTYFNHPYALSLPVKLEWSPDVFRLRDLEFTLADASISGFVDRKGDDTDAGLKLVRLPIDLLSINPLDLPIAGSLTLDAQIHEEKNRLKGDLKATIEKLELEEEPLLNAANAANAANERLNATGSFEGHFDHNRLDLKGYLQARDTPLLNLDFSIPIRFSIWPFQSTILYYMNAKGHIALNGQIEDFLDFFDMGSHRLEGECECDIRFSNTLNRPNLDGYCYFRNGFYQNYYSGTELHNIQAEWQANKEILHLRSLTAQDASQEGNFTAEGQIAVRPEDLFPFRFDISFSHLNFVQIDLVNAEANGKIHVQGNRTSALAKGNIEIVKSELTIPDHIPRPLPNLQVVYKNATHPVPPPESVVYKPYPLFLELHVSTPEKIVIAGRGLSSEWLGDFDIGGTYSSITAKGKLELDNGEFVFAGRSFKLSEGSLSFSGKEHEMPNLNIAGTLDQKGVKITVRMKGPVNSPQVTFQSIPALPLSSIMSYLLFGQNIGEISGFQALQLATSIASLAGQGPDIMESTRKALGLDRLRIIANPTEEGGESIALEVGTYVTEGVIVSISQGAEDSSTNISIEVEIKDNFSFQAESQQQTEQGKFSFKWFVNY